MGERGSDNRAKADKLAERLGKIFADRDDVKVSRPAKNVDQDLGPGRLGYQKR